MLDTIRFKKFKFCMIKYMFGISVYRVATECILTYIIPDALFLRQLHVCISKIGVFRFCHCGVAF
jgi:hypothetical protein